jgi:hypothetical protein
LREANDAVGADAVDGPLHDDAVGVILRGDLLPFVDQQRKGEMVLRPELRVAFETLRIDSENLGAVRYGFAPVLPELAELLRSPGGVVTRIEDQDDVFAA